ncbi:MAG: hypothetical protein ABI651_06630 [Verrucomicrobiota bacterium]
MRKRIQWLSLVLILASAGLVCLATLLEAVWIRAAAEPIQDRKGNRMEFNKPLTVGLVWEGIRRTKIPDIQRATNLRSILITTAALVGLFVMALSWQQPKSSLRVLFFLAQALIFYWGWVGLFFGLCTLLSLFTPLKIASMDGEWLAEGIPTLIAEGVWIAASMAIAGLSFDRASVRRPEPKEETDGARR